MQRCDSSFMVLLYLCLPDRCGPKIHKSKKDRRFLLSNFTLSVSFTLMYFLSAPVRQTEVLMHHKWQRQSGNSVRAKERDDGRFFLSLSTRTALERDSLTLRITLSLTRADRFQAGLSTLSVISRIYDKNTLRACDT